MLHAQRIQIRELVRAFFKGCEAVDLVAGDGEGVYDVIRRTLAKLG